MLLQGDISSNKTDILIESYVKLLNSGVKSSDILVILQNSNKKNYFIQKTLDNLSINAIESLRIYSFFGLVYNTISDNWAIVENLIPDKNNTKVLPNLTGLEISQYIMQQILKNVKFEGYNSKKSLMHQLFRRYSLIVQNNLSDKDVKWRSLDVLSESFAPDAKIALDEFKKQTLNARALDYLRQSLIFNYIYKNTDYFANIKYIFVDDADEITPICLDFIKFLKPQLLESFIAYDEFGTSRLGYLSAKKNIEFEKIFQENPQNLSSKTPLFKDATTIFDNASKNETSKLNNIKLLSFSKRAQMIDAVQNDIKKLLKNNIKASDITIITPIIDDMFKFSIKECFKNSANIIFLSGNEKLSQNPIVKTTLTILKLNNQEAIESLTDFDIRTILNFLQIPIKNCKNILENFNNTKKLTEYDFQIEDYNYKYSNFLNVLNEISSIKKLSEQVFMIYEKLVDIKLYSKEEITKFNFFLKQIEEFELVLNNIKNSEIINQVENSIISENPYSTLEISDQDLIIATPQKIIDNKIQTKFQFWLDVSSDQWVKSDTGPLYNAWVMQAGWDKNQFTLQDNINLSTQKTARILRKLTLCASTQIKAFASLFDGNGIENFGGIEKFISNSFEIKNITEKKQFIPRDDQKEVLNYKNGSMAISAVPGAGKTTILLELILKLLAKNIKPENIFVLTYMESAARNFRERIQNCNQELSQLPNISTIHGLALKILKENSNFERLGLNQDFEICDDSQRSRILRTLAQYLKVNKTELEDFDRATSSLKIGGSNLNTLTPNPSPLKGEGITITPCKYSKLTLQQAKKLRINLTEPEYVLWYYLRNNSFENFKFRRQAPIGKYIVDFVCFETKLIIELDSKQHLEKKQRDHDLKKDKFLNDEGFNIIRFYNFDILNNIENVLEKIHQELFPSPLRGEGLGVRVSNKSNAKLQKFLRFYEKYNETLKSNNLIDYDDMLILSVKLLEENPDILEYYQNQCEYIIEDEAQDSSAIQQKLINLLSARHKNLIRCGDINQAITTTFSNADVEGFRRFINSSDIKITMNKSQRCTKDVWQLANTLVKSSSNKIECKNAFYPIFMQPVEGKNPISTKAITPIIFDNEFMEKNYILKQIKKHLKENSKTTIGILLRSNYQVSNWTNFLNNAGLKTISRSECLEQKGIFRTIFAVMKFLEKPFDNEILAQSYETLSQLGHYPLNLYQTIKNEETPIIEINPDNIQSTDLLEFYWDMIYWLSFSALSPDELAIKIGLYYYTSDIEKSNVYLISTLIKRLKYNDNFSTLIERLGELSKKPSLSGFKFFSEEDDANNEFLEGKIQIMTLHKSKGDEFDAVFLPEMSEKNLPIGIKNITLKKNARFMESVKEINPQYKPKTDEELKEFLLAENLRLLYVAITRAKKKLYITANKTQKYSKTPEASEIFKQLGVN